MKHHVCIVLIGAALVAPLTASAWATASSEGLPFTEQTVGSVIAREATIYDVLVAVRQRNPMVVFGFEDDPALTRSRSIDFAFQSGTIASLIAALQASFAQYDVDTAEGIIQVHPHQPFTGGTLLDTHVAKFETHGRRLISDVISHLVSEVPELRVMMYGDSGVLGATISGGMEPEISFQAQNVTVRELLDRLALYSKRVAGQSNGIISPVSWHFVVGSRDQTPVFSTF